MTRQPPVAAQDGPGRLRQLFRGARTWWWFIALCVICATALSVWRLGHPPFYQSDTVLMVEVAAGPDGGYTHTVTGTRSVERLARSTSVLAEWITPQEISTSLSVFARGITTRSEPGLPLVRLRVNGATPEEAARLGELVAEATLTAAAEHGYRVTILQPPASLLTQQDAPLLRNAMLGAWAGLLLAGLSIAAVTLPSYRSSSRRAPAGSPVAIVPSGRRGDRAEDWLQRRSPGEAEQYGLLRLALLRHHPPAAGQAATVCVTGSSAPDAIDRVAHGLAASLAEHGRQTLIVRAVDEDPAGLQREHLQPRLDRLRLRVEESEAGALRDRLVNRGGTADGEASEVIVISAGHAATNTAIVVSLGADIVFFACDDYESLEQSQRFPYAHHQNLHVVYAIPTPRRLLPMRGWGSRGQAGRLNEGA